MDAIRLIFLIFLCLFAGTAAAETPLITCGTGNFLQSQASPPKYICATPSGSGTVTTTGTPTTNSLVMFSGSTSITNATNQIGTSGATIPLNNSANTFSGSNTQSGAYAVTTTSTPTQAAGTLGLAGTATKPTLGANSEGDIFLTSTGGFNIIGQGSTNDWSLFNKSGTSVCTVATGATNFNCTGLQVGGTNVLTGNQSITLSGDTTGTGTTAITTTTSKVNGVSYGTSPSTNTVPVVTSANTITYETVPNAALANSSITIGGQSISLGGTTTNQGNGGKLQLSTGTTTTNDCVKFDANGNTVDAGAACGSGSGGGGTLNYSDNGVTLTANTYFTPPGGGGIPQTTEANVAVAAPSNASISNLQVSVSAAPGAGNSYTITFRDASSDTALTCAISGASATSCNDSTHSVNITKGDLISWKLVSAGTIITTPTLTIAAANGTSGVGVTSITAGAGLTGGTITTSGTIALDLTQGNTWTGTTTLNPGSGIAEYVQAGAVEQAVFSNGNSGTSKALNCDNGNVQSVSITGAVTFTFSTPTHPCKFTMLVTQDATGHVYAYPAAVLWPAGTAPTLSTAANAKDAATFVYDGTSYWGEGSTAFATSR